MDISRTIANIAIIFSAIYISIKTITFEKFHCCGDAPVNCLLQFFCFYFYNFCSYFVTLNFLFTFLVSFLLLYICRLIFVDCMFIFFQYTLNEQLILRRKICARKKSCNFFKMQLFKKSIVTQTEAMWRIKYKIFLSPEEIWSANVAGCWRTVRRSPKLNYVTLWSRDHKRSSVKLKT